MASLPLRSREKREVGHMASGFLRYGVTGGKEATSLMDYQVSYLPV